MLKATGDSFMLKLYARIKIFTKAFCIWKWLFLKELFLEDAYFNAYI